MTQSTKLFGTDGIRGEANKPPMDAATALLLGQAAGQVFLRGEHRHLVVIGKDTRLSGYLLEPALTAGFISVGMDVILLGPLPTPAVAMLVKSLRADLGVVISASHNAYADNGIKLFGPNGFKLNDDTEAQIEALMRNPAQIRMATPDHLGRARRLEYAQGRYIEFVKATFPRHLSLEGIKLVLDCAHGAAYHVAPLIFRELGAEVIPLGIAPDGININEECGSTAPEAMCEAVVREDAQLGIALDGDADRVILCDEKGKIIDGDQLLAAIATHWHYTNQLKGNCVVATHMSNLGFERYIQQLGLTLFRANVGDRYVIEKMRELGCNLGGEQSGHIILSDYTTTGDGIIAALQLLAYLLESRNTASSIPALYEKLPQILKNIRYSGPSPLGHANVQKTIDAVRAKLDTKGRVLVRASGTEPLIRIMLEGEDEQELHVLAETISASLHAHMAQAA